MNEPLSQLRAINVERLEIQTKLRPLTALMTKKQSELAQLREAVTATDLALDAAIKHSATTEGQHVIGEKTAAEAKTARQARERAETLHQQAQAASVGARSLSAEIEGLSDAGRNLAFRLAEIDASEKTTTERYLRGLADQAAGEYADAANVLANKLAVVLAYQQALAAADLVPDLLTAGVWNFGIPGLNSPSARTAGGCLVEIEHCRQLQPQALTAIRARISADCVSVAGLS